MKQNNLLLKVIIALCAIGLIFSSCKKDEETKPDDSKSESKTIAIDENSAFNMDNFITSFNQLFSAYDRWEWDVSHDYKDGKVITSYQNYKIYGEFGDGAQITTHNYNSEGIITSSNGVSKIYRHRDVSFEYEFNLEGFITKLTKYKSGELSGIVNLEYNDKKQLIKKTHEPIYASDDVKEETFTYNSDGKVATYYDEVEILKEYKYSNGNMIEEKYFYNGVLDHTETVEYDNEGRITKTSKYDNTWITIIQYTSDKMTLLIYEDDILNSKYEYRIEFDLDKKYSYKYDSGGTLTYCKVKEQNDGLTIKKYYYTGSVDNLQLEGYTIIDSRDESKDNTKTKESIYDASGNKLYYFDFEITLEGGENGYWDITGSNCFKADGTSIEVSEITESWIFKLVSKM